MRRCLLLSIGLALLVSVAATQAAQQTQQSPALSFDFYRTHIEPIFLKQRDAGQGAGRACASCHTSVASRLRLQPLSPGAVAWTEDQSRQNFQLAAALVTAGEPLQSRLLLHPLAAEAGGDPAHNGGKFWQSQNDPEWQTLAAWVRGASGILSRPGATAVQSTLATGPSLDYEFFRTRVEPIFLERRSGHARCYACHALGAGEGNAPAAMRLQMLSPGSTTWNEDQSRKNFEAVRQKVVPGHPQASPLLIHPLRYEAGGDQWHGGGAQFTSANEPEWQTIAAWVQGKNAVSEGTLTARASSLAGATGNPRNSVSLAASNTATQGLKLRIVQTNMAGDNLHIIDPATNRVVGEVIGIEANHGVAAAPDGSRLYVSNEADRTVDVVDTRTLKVFKQIPLSGPPNNIAISKDGRRLYQAIHGAPYGVDVIDTATLANAKRLPLDGMQIHNTYVTPDGKYVIAASDDQTFTVAVIDQKTEEHVRSIKFTNRPRPLAFHTNTDGSTKWVLAGLSELHGFVVADFATGKEIHRIKFPDLGGPVKMQVVRASTGNPNHGIGVQPDNKAVWVTDRLYNAVHAYSLPDLKYLGAVPVAVDPFWMTFTPDSKFVYVANDASASVSAIDTQSMKEVARIPVGQVPKRNITAMLP
jgi:YVTN family beta-propeller protein